MARALMGALLALAVSCLECRPAASETLDDIKARDLLACGVGRNLLGFSSLDGQGVWRGLSVDACRALAVAILGDARKVKFVALDAPQHDAALKARKIDVLASNMGFSLTRDTEQGADFAGAYYHGRQGLLVPRGLGLKSARALDGARICVEADSGATLALADYFGGSKLSFTPVVFDKFDDMRAAFLAGRCQAMTSHLANLQATRMAYAPEPNGYAILPQFIGKVQLGVAVRHGDSRLLDVARWSLHATLVAEEYGLTSGNVDQLRASRDPVARRFLGGTSSVGEALGIDENWAHDIVRQVGNYAEIYDRNLGSASPLGIPRGMNELGRNGGLLIAPSMRGAPRSIAESPTK